MPTCPNCGGAVDAPDAVCGHCGAALGDRGGGEDAPHEPAAGTGKRSGPEQPAHAGDRRPAGNVGSVRQRPAGARHPPPQPPADEDRRDLVKYGIAAVGLAGVGWLLLNGDSEQGQNPRDYGSSVEDPPQVNVSFSTDYDANELRVVIQSVHRADAVTIDATDCAGVSGEVEFSRAQAGESETISPAEGASCEVVVTATYEGNTQVVGTFDYEDV